MCTFLLTAVTCGGLTNERTTWKTIYFAKDPIMKLWRYGIINLLREAYNSGELTFPEGICGANPTPTEFNNWLDEHYQNALDYPLCQTRQ